MYSANDNQDILISILLILLKCSILLALLSFSLFWMFRKRPSEAKKAHRFFDGFFVGGHRGSPLKEPENTLASMQQAKDEGVQLVEFDVSLTKDGVAVLLHDDTLERTTNLSGFISEIYYKDLKDCNCASNFVFNKSDPKNDKIRHLPMPLLEEMVKWAVANEMKLLFDIKAADKPLLDKLEYLFKTYDLYDKAIICSFFPKVVYQVKSKDPNILTGITWRRWFISYADLEGKIPRFNSVITTFIAMAFDIVYIWCIKTWLPAFLGVNMILTERSEISENFIKHQQRAGRQVCAWTVNDPNEMVWLRKTLKIPFLTDKPFLAKEMGCC